MEFEFVLSNSQSVIFKKSEKEGVVHVVLRDGPNGPVIGEAMVKKDHLRMALNSLP